MGASLAMAGMTACTKQPLEPIVPYVKQPEELVPGRPMFYATAFELGGYASPVLVESHMYRPTKAEGNEQHPASMGGTDVYAQASILDMYDPDRSQTITYMGDERTWGSFVSAIRGPLSVQKGLKGAGVRLLTQTVSSPTLADQIKAFLQVYPEAKWHAYEPINRDNVLEGAKLAFGQPVETRYDFSKADVILSLDADFLSAGFPGSIRYARDYAKRRNPDSGAMNRLYVVESNPSATGAKADHHLPLRTADVEQFAAALSGGAGASLSGEARKFAAAITKELPATHGSSIVIVGDHQPPAVHALAHTLNVSLGNVGKTVFYTDPVDANPINQTESLKELVADMRGGKVDMLVILGGNPAYDAPADFGFADALKGRNVPLRIHHGLYQDETAELCHWHVNEAHYLESWGDARAYDGTVSIVQPLIAPLYGGRSAVEFVGTLAGGSDVNGHELVQAYWKKQHSGADFDTFWRKSLHDGWVEGTTFAPKQLTAKTSTLPAAAAPAPGIEINFRRDPSIYDGRFANNGWLQELPKPMSKLTWDSAVLVSPQTAQQLSLASKDLVELELNGKTVKAPVWIQAGHADNSVTVSLLATGAGVQAAPEPAPVSTCMSCATARLRGSQPARSSATPAQSTCWLPPRATRRWKPRTAATVRWCAPPTSRSTAKSRTSPGKMNHPRSSRSIPATTIRRSPTPGA